MGSRSRRKYRSSHAGGQGGNSRPARCRFRSTAPVARPGSECKRGRPGRSFRTAEDRCPKGPQRNRKEAFPGTVTRFALQTTQRLEFLKRKIATKKRLLEPFCAFCGYSPLKGRSTIL